MISLSERSGTTAEPSHPPKVMLSRRSVVTIFSAGRCVLIPQYRLIMRGERK
jgi:hypothetical protein